MESYENDNLTDEIRINVVQDSIDNINNYYILFFHSILFIPAIIIQTCTLCLFIIHSCQYLNIVINIVSLFSLLLIYRLVTLDILDINEINNNKSQLMILKILLIVSTVMFFIIYSHNLDCLIYPLQILILLSAVMNIIILVLPIFIILIILAIILLCFPCVIQLLKDPNNGMTNNEINKIKSKIYVDNNNDKCSICLETIKSGTTIRILKCKHNYHQACLDNWLRINNTCPICRDNISEHII
jgi:hypothetical protein